MKKTKLLFLLSLVLLSCNENDDDDFFTPPEKKCDCVAIYTARNGLEFTAQFWSSNDCSKNGDIVLYQNIEHEVRCTQK